MALDAVIIVGADGVTRHLVDPVSERIAEAIGPKVSTQRSSHIETWRDLSLPARRWILQHHDMIGSLKEDRLWWFETSCDTTELTNHFWADMLPSGGGVLGPFKNYEDANAAEIKYLQELNLPTPFDTIQ